MLWRGWPIEKLLCSSPATSRAASRRPASATCRSTIPVATQLPHAVGLAYAAQYRGDDAVVMAYFGDGATSEGDFHEALNFAGVWHVPVVFVCQNNQWAISVPLKKQTHSRTIAQKALAYGLPGIQVDGNDVLAVYAAAREAVERARARRGAHADRVRDVSPRRPHHRRRSDQVPLRGRSRRRGSRRTRSRASARTSRSSSLLDAGLEAEVDEEIAAAVRRFEATPPPDPLTIFDHVYARAARRISRRSGRRSSRARVGHPARAQPPRPEPPRRRAADARAALTTARDADGQAEHGQGAQPGAAPGDGARRRRARSWARTSASTAASSGSPTTCSASSAPSA